MINKLQPPQPAIVWDHTPESLKAESNNVLANARSVLDSVAALPRAERSFDAVFVALARMENALNSRADILRFYRDVAPDAALREASERADEALNAFNIEREMRADLFAAVCDTVPIAVSGEDARFVDHVVRAGRRAGLDLPEERRKELEILMKELATLSVAWRKNLNEQTGKISFSLDDLEGVPADAINGYTRLDNGRLEIKLKGSDTGPILGSAKSAETRRITYTASGSRLAANAVVLDNVLTIRRKLAKILNYDTWADYSTELKMVKNAKNVVAFLDDLERKLRPVGERDREELLKLKQELEDPSATELLPWDWNYYGRIWTNRALQIDSSTIKEYFPIDHVVSTTLQLYKDMLGLEFVLLSSDVETGDVWHPDVTRYAVWNADATEADDFVGYMYLDLYPREGKYPNNTMFPLQPGYIRPDGSRSYPSVAMLANLGNPTPDRPALSTHWNVTQFFHEMGHIFHGLVSRTKYSRFHGVAVTTDFGEAPSQMLENWCWEPKVLEIMTSHYKTKEPAPAELINKIVQSRYQQIGLFILYQVFLAKYDITIHTDKVGQDYTELWADMMEKVALRKRHGPALPSQGAFPHLVGGDYDAGYYSYQYSNVFAADMYRTVFAKDIFSIEAGMRYRKEILLPGASRDEMESLKAFLGREPNSDALLQQMLGLNDNWRVGIDVSYGVCAK